MYKEIIYGPPGTGKTTYLMKLLSEALKTTPSEKIAFVSFTRQGTYEGVARAVKEFNLSKEQTKHFKTIHSLCFSNLGVNRSMMINKNHYKLLSEQTGIVFTGYYTQDFNSVNDAYLHTLSMLKHNPKFGALLSRPLNARKLKYIEYQYLELKKQLGILDFDDLLTQYLEHGDPLDVATAFIDEGQDLTPLQWKVVNKLFSNATTIYVAGDDDQAVYEWSGAKVSEFLNFSSNSVVLKQSYRLPKNILSIATKITSDIKRRKAKVFAPKDVDGKLSAITNLNQLKLKGGELVLARTNWILRKMTQDFLSSGIPFSLKGKLSLDKLTVKAILAHKQYEKGVIDQDAVSKYKVYFKSLDKVPWQEVVLLPSNVMLHYDNVLIKHNLSNEPVKFETYHSCKGSENDHVILTPELSQKVYSGMFKRYDSELRCLYVGMTRTKKDLTIIMPNSKRFYPSKYFQ